MKDRPSISLLRDILRYDEGTGLFYWKVDWSSKAKAGDQAMRTKMASGHLVGMVNGVQLYAHIVAVAIKTGEWPVGEVDHKDTDPGNNRWKNLRPATSTENKQNRKVQSNSSSGLKGAFFCKDTGRWRSKIKTPNGMVELGRFDTPEAAHAAYAAAAIKYHGDFARTE